MKIVRSLLAVAGGVATLVGILYFVTPIVARYYHAEDFRTINAPYMMANLAYSCVASVIAGLVTAWIAGYREIRHASILGFLMIVMSFISMRLQAEHQPGWYEVVIGGCGPIAAMLGAALRMLIRRKSPAA